MKKNLIRLISACLVWMGTTELKAEVSFSAGIQIGSTADFYQPLSSYGSWVAVAPYGRCWRPARIDTGWRPYTVGYWEWTDFGWYWVSDEPWAWACYHYGSWVLDPYYGWIWVPGVEWAPAWVTWRESEAYVGWAPCAPAGVVVVPSFFVFIEYSHFHGHFQRSALRVGDPTLFNRTRTVGDFRRERRTIDGVERRVVYNPGPAVDRVQRASGSRVTQVPVQQVIRQTPAPATLRRTPEPVTREQKQNQTPPTVPVPRQEVSPRPATPYQPAVPERPQTPTGRERPYESVPPDSGTVRPTVPGQPVGPAPQPPVNPAGRERGYERHAPSAPPAAAPQRPPEPNRERPQGPPPGQEKHEDRDKP